MAKGLAIIILIITLLIPLSLSAVTYHPDGIMLLSRCERTIKMIQSGKKEFISGWCLGFVQGALNSHRVYSIYLAGKLDKNASKEARVLWEKKVRSFQLYCLPPNTNLGDVVIQVVSYLKENPQLLNFDSAFLVHKALNKAYPCKNE